VNIPVHRWIWMVLVAGVALGAWRMWPSEEKRVRRVIEGLAKDASFTSGEGNISRISKVNSIAERFTVDAELHVDQVVPVDAALRGRDTIQGLLMAAVPLMGAVQVDVHDLQVTMGEEGTASAILTASAKTGGKRADFNAQEFELRLRKVEGVWLIARVEAVLGYRKPRIQ
jgi:hypothetical protein